MPGLLDAIEAVPRAALGLLGLGQGQSDPAAASAAPGAPDGPPGLLSPQSYLHPVRDAILKTLGGAAGRLDDTLQQQDLMRYQRDRNVAIYNTLPDDQSRQAFAMDPQGFITSFWANHAPQKAAGGETVMFNGPGGQQVTAPLLSNDNGRVFTQTPTSMTQTGNTGPQLGAADGVIVDKRGLLGQGGVVGTFGAPQKFGPGEHGESYSPPVSITGAGAGPTPPQLPPSTMASPSTAQPPASTSPAPALDLKSAPGVLSQALGVPVQITSGLRTPAHNAAVGGVPNSAHLTGNAVDFVPHGMSSSDAVARLAQAGLPFDQLIDEGSNVHIAWGGQQRGQVLRRTPQGGYVPIAAGPSPAAASSAGAPSAQTPASAAPGVAPTIAGGFSGGPPPAPLWSAPHKVPGAEGLYQTSSATGEIRKAADAPFGAAQINPLYERVTQDEAYKQAEAASSAYQALVSNAGKMTGPAAYSILDAFARAINPPGMARPSTIKAIEGQLGMPANAIGRLQNLAGNGSLPLQTQQQILDAVLGFGQAHWDQANALVKGNVDFAQRHPEINAKDIVPPLAPRPERYVIPTPGAPGAPAPGAQRAPDGNWYVADPKRPGKYLMVRP